MLPAEKWDCRFGQQTARGLGCAHLLQSPAIRLPSGSMWSTNRLTVDFIGIDKIRDAFEERTVTILHGSEASHLASHATTIAAVRERNVKDGATLWRDRAKLFPNLDFCESVERDVSRLGKGDARVPAIIRHLHDLEEYSKSTAPGPFDPQRLGFVPSPESEATMQQFGEKRTFRGPDGKLTQFSWHYKMSPDEWRLYFLHRPTGQPRFLIGYIVPHLRTQRFDG